MKNSREEFLFFEKRVPLWARSIRSFPRNAAVAEEFANIGEEGFLFQKPGSVPAVKVCDAYDNEIFLARYRNRGTKEY